MSKNAPVHEKKQNVEKEDCFAGGGPMLDPADLMDINDAVVCIQLKDRYFASGIYVKIPKLDRNCILTCEHVIINEHSQVKFLHQRKKESFTILLASSVKLVWHDQWVYDFQVLSLSDENVALIYSKGVDPILLQKPAIDPEPGEFVKIVHHPEGRQKCQSEKSISYIDGAYIGYNANTMPGSSGGAIVWNDKLVGLHQEANKTEKANQGTLISKIVDIINQCSTKCPDTACEINIACYTGELKDGVFCGCGVVKCTGCGSQDAGVYEDGELRQGSREFGYGSQWKSDRYEGGFQNGRFDGYGVYKFACGSTYEGEWKDNTPTGNLEVAFANGEKAAYVWEFDEKTDVLTWRLAEGITEEIHEGNWSDFVFGHGKSYVNEMYVYEGDWLNGKAHGHGTHAFEQSEHCMYIGEWEAGKRCGQGLNTFENGGEQEGEFRYDKLNGHARYKYRPGKHGKQDEYIGEFVDTVRHGNGVYTFGSGASYKCNWEKGEPIGLCSVAFADGKQCEVVWEPGGNAHDTCVFASGQEFVGSWKDLINSDCSARTSTYRSPNGDTYWGMLLDGKRHGLGRSVDNKCVYDGKWKDDKLHGKCKLTYTRSGNTRRGQWKSGMPDGVIIYCRNGVEIIETYVDGTETLWSALTNARHFLSNRKTNWIV